MQPMLIPPTNPTGGIRPQNAPGMAWGVQPAPVYSVYVPDPAPRAAYLVSDEKGTVKMVQQYQSDGMPLYPYLLSRNPMVLIELAVCAQGRHKMKRKFNILAIIIAIVRQLICSGSLAEVYLLAALFSPWHALLIVSFLRDPSPIFCLG